MSLTYQPQHTPSSLCVFVYVWSGQELYVSAWSWGFASSIEAAQVLSLKIIRSKQPWHQLDLPVNSFKRSGQKESSTTLLQLYIQLSNYFLELSPNLISCEAAKKVPWMTISSKLNNYFLCYRGNKQTNKQINQWTWVKTLLLNKLANNTYKLTAQVHLGFCPAKSLSWSSK